jgi:hypothetical protein
LQQHNNNPSSFSLSRCRFRTPLKESEQKEVEISNINPPTFLDVLEYLYTDRVSPNKNLDDAIALLSAANRFLLTRLKLICEEIIISKGLNLENIIPIFQAADLYSAPHLLNAAAHFILSHCKDSKELDEILTTKSFRNCIIEFLQKNMKLMNAGS